MWAQQIMVGSRTGPNNDFTSIHFPYKASLLKSELADCSMTTKTTKRATSKKPTIAKQTTTKKKPTPKPAKTASRDKKTTRKKVVTKSTSASTAPPPLSLAKMPTNSSSPSPKRRIDELIRLTNFDEKIDEM